MARPSLLPWKTPVGTQAGPALPEAGPPPSARAASCWRPRRGRGGQDAEPEWGRQAGQSRRVLSCDSKLRGPRGHGGWLGTEAPARAARGGSHLSLSPLPVRHPHPEPRASRPPRSCRRALCGGEGIACTWLSEPVSDSCPVPCPCRKPAGQTPGNSGRPSGCGWAATQSDRPTSRHPPAPAPRR